MTDLWHYTCDHGHERITDRLLPGTHLVPDGTPTPWTMDYVWLTDLDAPARGALGLTSNHIDCDRTAHRYRVTDDSACVRWVDWARMWPRWQRDGVELAPGARPLHWWISPTPVPVKYAPRVTVAA